MKNITRRVNQSSALSDPRKKLWAALNWEVHSHVKWELKKVVLAQIRYQILFDTFLAIQRWK